MESWPQSLKVALQILLSSRFPMQILWGPEYIQFYNDAYVPIAGNKHPAGIGQRGADCWQEVWEFSGALLDRVMATGEATWSEDQPLVLNRNGQAEEGYFTFSYTPIWEESEGAVGGVFIAVNETTQKILGERRERALRAEAQAVTENLGRVLTSISDEFMMFDADWRFTYVNDRAVAALQRPREALLGQSIWAVFPGAVSTSFYAELHRAVAAQTATTFELFCEEQGRWLENRVYPFSNGVSLLRVDITARKNLERALQISQDQLDSILNTAPASIARCRFFADRTYVLDYRSVGCEALTGYSLAEITPELWAERTFEEDYAAIAGPMFEAVFAERPITVEYRFRHRDGSLRWIADSLTSRRAEAQDCWIVTMVGMDITPRRQAEEALRESEDRYRVLAEAMPQMVWMADRSGVQYWNQRWYDYTGLPREDALGVGGTNVVHPEEQGRVMELWQLALEQGVGFDLEQRIRRHDGVYRWFLNRGLPVQDASSGEVTRWVGTITDVDDKKQLETQRARLLEQERIAREAAENANRIKDEFLAVLSHELRSPLNPILGWAKLLRTTQLNETKTAYALEVIERNARLQAQLIDDLLDVSRILRGKLVLNTLPTALTAVIDDALETVRALAEAKGVELHTQLDDAPFTVMGDGNRLKQVVWNLLSNAVKFTPQGGRVAVQLSYAGPWAEIRVSDTGKGIAADFLPHVFDRFRQADSTTTRDFGGLGLGLAIADQIVEMHQGTIAADSPGDGQGATFTVRLPVTANRPAPDRPNRPTSSSHLQNIHVMIVEDDADSRSLITTTLQQFGAQVTALPAAADAITALAQVNPDILVSDIGMPDMDGYMLIQHIRDMAHTQQIPAIALTAYTTETDQQKSLLAGFQRHLPKPMELSQLIEAITALVQCNND
ncbi:MAG TPA: PAS domain S-box protein [Nodosilinea sp.]|nr:PAS domain S-box protein [Nodosilinea sp.]